MSDDTSSTFQVKYISGFLTVMNRPAQFVFHDKSVKVTLPADKKKSEEVLFNVPVSEVKSLRDYSGAAWSSGNVSNIPQVAYIVNGKKYGFLPGDGSFLGNLQKLNDKMV